MEDSDFIRGYEGHLSPSDSWYKSVFSSGLIVLDTNVLLDLYRMQDEARDAMLDVLQKTRERLWVPAQVRKEFWANRATVISESLNLSSTYISTFEKEISSAQKVVNEWANRISVPTQSRESLGVMLNEIMVQARNLMTVSASNVDEQWIKEPHTDAVLSKVARLLHQRVGEGFDQERIQKEIAEFGRRAKELVPPGFRDAGKTKGDSHGDYFIWRELLDQVSKEPTDVLFVTGDTKSDWQREVRGRKIGPLPELVQEFMSVTGNKSRFHLTSASGLLTLAMVHVPKTSIDESVINLADGPSAMRRSQQQVGTTRDEIKTDDFTDSERRRLLQKFAAVLQERYRPIFDILLSSLSQDGVIEDGSLIMYGRKWESVAHLTQEMELALNGFTSHRNLNSHELAPWRLESTRGTSFVITRLELTPWFAEAIENRSGQ